MKGVRTTVFARALSCSSGAGLVFALSPILLLLAGSFPELSEHANVEFGFSLLATLGASCYLVGLVSGAYRTLDLPLPILSPLVRLPASPEPSPDERPETRERALPVVTPSLVLPTLISGLGGWVGFAARAPRAERRPSAA